MKYRAAYNKIDSNMLDIYYFEKGNKWWVATIPIDVARDSDALEILDDGGTPEFDLITNVEKVPISFGVVIDRKNKWFGATDGSIDNTAAIQAAMDQ